MLRSWYIWTDSNPPMSAYTPNFDGAMTAEHVYGPVLGEAEDAEIIHDMIVDGKITQGVLDLIRIK